MLLFALAGCSLGDSDEPLQGDYGRNTGERFSASVNGLNVLGEMFTEAHNKVSAAKDLSRALTQQADAILWAPDNFNVPDPQTCQAIRNWLQAKENRTFVYIGRDFDARPYYWRQIIAQAGSADTTRYKKELDKSVGLLSLQRVNRPDDAACEFFSIDGTAPHLDVRTLGGPWANGIDAPKVDIELNSRLMPAEGATTLLSAGNPDDKSTDDKVIVSESWVDSVAESADGAPGASNFLLVANGSFLFNVPLVNHEHRKLAKRLIDLIGTDKQVVILDSQNHGPIEFTSGGDDGGGSGGGGSGSSGNRPHHNDKSPPEQAPQSMLDIFNVWPLSAILVQFGILIVAICFAKWPIFGPPRDPPPPPASDFGRHVEALGSAMAVTGDADYAKSRVQQYRQMRDSAGARAISRTIVKKQS